ncbi:MAG: S9 family peptidase [Parvularculaceae bacterium]
MTQSRRMARGAFAFFFTIAAAGANAQPADPAVYGALPSVSEAAISPDGKAVALLQHAGATSAVMFYDLDSPGSKPTGVGIGDIDARDIVWANDDRILLLTSQSSKVPTNAGLQTIEFFRWLTVSKSKKSASVLLGNEPGYYLGDAGNLLAFPADNPRKAIFARGSITSGVAERSVSRLKAQVQDTYTYSLIEVDVESGSQKRLDAGNENTTDWIVNASGKPVMRIDRNATSRENELYVNLNGDGRLERLTPIDKESGSFDFYGVSATPGMLIASAYSGDKTALFEYNIADGRPGAVLFSNANYDFDHVIYDPHKATATGVRYVDDMKRTYYLDEADRQTQATLRKAIPNASPRITSKSADGSRMTVEVSYADHPPQFYLFDKTARSLNMIAVTYAALDGKTVAKKEKYDYVSPDGLTIHGYLTVPTGSSKQNAPLIVLPHGGPESRADQEFDYWSFFYAARGYIVYEPNFRGSEGYGRAFRSAGYGEWGRKMQDDITNGVKKLVADGVADPNRICIVGASYGGYAALAGATLTPDLYACAVSVNGISNLPAMLGEAARASTLGETYWSRRIGDRFRDLEELRAVSPKDNAAQVKAPIMLIVSKHDVVVAVDQSKIMRTMLEGAHKPYEYVELDGEDHWLSSSAARTEMLSRSIAFIDKHIGK